MKPKIESIQGRSCYNSLCQAPINGPGLQPQPWVNGKIEEEIEAEKDTNTHKPTSNGLN